MDKDEIIIKLQEITSTIIKRSNMVINDDSVQRSKSNAHDVWHPTEEEDVSGILSAYTSCLESSKMTKCNWKLTKKCFSCSASEMVFYSTSL